MIREEYMPERWHDTAGHGSLLGAYIIGMLGAGIVIAVGLIAGIQSGWLQHAQTEMGQIVLPKLSVVAQGSMPEVLQALTADVKDIRETATTSLQEHSEQLKPLAAASHSHVADKKN